MSAGGLLVPLAFGVAAADARAAVVDGERVQRYAGPGTVPVLLIAFAAAPREANSLEVRADPAARTWRLRDAGATLDAAGECRPHSPHEVVCPMPAGARVAEFRVALGDGDDRAGLDVAAGLPATGYVHGGEGDDVATAGGPFSLSGDTGNDVLTAMFTEGGPGDDALTIAGGRDGAADGGPGTDRVTGGPTNDVLEGGSGIDAVLGAGGNDSIGDGDELAVDRDRLDGGPGYDTVSWRSHPVAIDVDLAATGPEGQAAGTDDVTGFEAAAGGLGDDRLRGDDGPNELSGGAGDDRLAGAGGRDGLFGESGRDRLEGGAGRDALDGDDGRDRLDGGGGADTLRSAADFFADRVACDRQDHGTADEQDRVHGRCPQVMRLPGQLLENHATRRGRRMRVHFSCLDRYPDCHGLARVRARIGWRRVRIGRLRFGCAGGAPCEDGARTRLVRLPGPVRRELRRRGRVTLELLIVLRPGRRAGVIPIRDRIALF